MKLFATLAKGLGYNPNRGAGGRFASGPSIQRHADKLEARIKASKKLPGSSKSMLLNHLDSVDRNVENSRHGDAVQSRSDLTSARQMLEYVDDAVTLGELPKGKVAILGDLRAAARAGDRIVYNGKTIHGGVGNPSGLHGYYTTVAEEGAAKSAARVTRAVEQAKRGDVFEVHSFRNITRDRGRWVRAYSHKVK